MGFDAGAVLAALAVIGAVALPLLLAGWLLGRPGSEQPPREPGRRRPLPPAPRSGRPPG